MDRGVNLKAGDKVVYDYRGLRYPNGEVIREELRDGRKYFFVEHTNGLTGVYVEGELEKYDGEDIIIENPELWKYENVVGKEYGTTLNVSKIYCDKETVMRLLIEINNAIEKALSGKKFMHKDEDMKEEGCVLKVRFQFDEKDDE